MTSPKPHLPWMKWYPADWRAEPRLKMVSRAARSLWIDMLGLMHESKRCGYLIVANTPLKNAAAIAKSLGDNEPEISPLLDELETNSVFSRNRDGTIFSRRMVRDTKKHESSAKGGRLGGATTYEKQKGIFSTQGTTQGTTQEPRGQRPEARGQNTLLRNDASASKPKEAWEGNQAASKPIANDKQWCWTFGAEWLATTTGKSLAQAKSVVGSCLRDTNPKDDYAALRSIIEACQENGTKDPIPWIKGGVIARAKAAAPFDQTDDYGWRKRFASFRDNGTWPPQWGGTKPGDDPRHPEHLVKAFGFERAA